VKEAGNASDALIRCMLADKSPAERMQMCSRMLSTVKPLVLAGTSEKKELTPVGARRELFVRLYGREFTQAQCEAILKAIGSS